MEIIAVGFAEKMSADMVNLALTENGCEALYARSFIEATMIYALDNSMTYSEWKDLYATCKGLSDSFSQTDTFAKGKIRLKDLRDYVNRESVGDSYLTGRMTEQLREDLKRIRKPIELIDYITENAQDFSEVREKARYYFCKYFLLYIENKCSNYLDACRKNDILRKSGADRFPKDYINPELAALDELSILSPLTPLKNESVKLKSNMSTQEKEVFLESMSITPGGLFDEFNYFYFGYVSTDKLELLFELFGDPGSWPVSKAKAIARAFGFCSQEPTMDELAVAFEKLEQIADDERKREVLIDEEYERENVKKNIYQRDRTGENYFRDIINGKRDINRSLLIAFLMFVGKSVKLGDGVRISRPRLNKILLECGFSQLRPDDPFDCFCMKFINTAETMDLVEKTMESLVTNGKDFYLYKVYKDSYSRRKELLKYLT